PRQWARTFGTPCGPWFRRLDPEVRVARDGVGKREPAVCGGALRGALVMNAVLHAEVQLHAGHRRAELVGDAAAHRGPYLDYEVVRDATASRRDVGLRSCPGHFAALDHEVRLLAAARVWGQLVVALGV